jgi:hypothetical protein
VSLFFSYGNAHSLIQLHHRGFLRRRKSIMQSTTAPIIIDKHELHSTWPLYQQPESRQITKEGVLLVVERAQTCYGPGDRVAVMATLKSDGHQAVILRGFEFTLKETTIFHGGTSSSKKSAPQVKTAVIGEQKVPVHATINGGSQHRAELYCIIPKDHTTTSLTSARHIDIIYTINVKALMDTGAHVLIDLPVIVSNWPRCVDIFLNFSHSPGIPYTFLFLDQRSLSRSCQVSKHLSDG